jgi:ABC-type nitrate/sulfonate/bicarbonate transport system substrate-binding protein
MRNVKSLLSFMKIVIAGRRILFFSNAPCEARKVSVGVAVLDVTMTAFFIARERGYFHKEDIDVDLVLMRGGVSNQALIANGVDFSAVPTAGLQAALQGAPLKVIFSAFHKPMFWLYARPEIHTVKELTGKKVAVSSLGAAGDAALRELFKKAGMDENRDVAILAIGTTATRLTALSTGSVDAAMMTFPHNLTAAEQGFRELVSFLTSDIVQLQGAVVARDQTLQSDPMLVEKLLRGTIRGFLYMTSNRAGTVSVLQKYLKAKPEVAAKVYDLIRPAITPEGILNEDLEKRFLTPLLERIGRKDMPPLNRYFDFSAARKIHNELKAEGWKP